MNLKRAFAEGLLIGTGANLIADAISGHARETGASNTHILMIGIFLFGLFLLVWSAESQ
jgi:hypothetical protein